MTDGERRLSGDEVREQAYALLCYSQRGGSVSRWLDSKQFLESDRAAILAAFFRLDESEEAAS